MHTQEHRKKHSSAEQTSSTRTVHLIRVATTIAVLFVILLIAQQLQPQNYLIYLVLAFVVGVTSYQRAKHNASHSQAQASTLSAKRIAEDDVHHATDMYHVTDMHHAADAQREAESSAQSVTLAQSSVQHTTSAEALTNAAEEPNKLVIDDAEKDEAQDSHFDKNSFIALVCRSSHPVDDLKHFVTTIRSRQDEGKKLSGIELFAARMLDESGIFSDDMTLPRIAVVLLGRSHMFYIHPLVRELSYAARVRLLKLEAALNAIVFAATYADDPACATEEDAYKLNQALWYKICAQSAALDEPLPSDKGSVPDGEWACRHALATALESARLPFRLETRFRANVRDGNVSFELSMIPSEAFPDSMYVHDLGVVKSSKDMRRKAASAYALRVALLLAAWAFRSSKHIRHVWVAITHDTATRHWCYLSVDFDRWRFSKLDLSHTEDLKRIYRSFVPNWRYEDGILRPVEQSFSLEEPRFCPAFRHERISLSHRQLKGSTADALGTHHVSGLAIEESEGRALAASKVMSQLTPWDQKDATQHNVHMVLEVAGDDPDPSVRDAAKRTVARMLDGTLDENPFAIAKEFMEGDGLSLALDNARKLLAAKKAERAAQLLEEALAPLDAAGVYSDSEHVEWRYFSSFVDRAISNRLFGGELTMLVPNSYFEAHMLAAIAYLSSGHPEQATTHARRMVELAPLGSKARLFLVRCLEAQGKEEQALEELQELLTLAHDPASIGMAYYHMGSLLWRAGKSDIARACLNFSLHFLPQAAGIISMELATLALQSSAGLEAIMDPEEAAQVLKDNDIALAPTPEISEIVYDCARASVDAEIFPVAQGLVGTLGLFTEDDVIMDIIRSIEDAPDQ